MRPFRPAHLALAALLAAAAAALLLTRAPDDPGAARCADAARTAARLKPLATGEIAAFRVAETPRPLPPLAFAGVDGKALTLADFTGRTVLLNLWATWCIPCRREMPALAALQKELGGPGFEVVAVNIDTRNLDRPKEWLAETGITALAYYSDPQAKVFQELRSAGKATGMPTTLLVDGRGCELGLLQGAAEWASPEAKALVQAALAR